MAASQSPSASASSSTTWCRPPRHRHGRARVAGEPLAGGLHLLQQVHGSGVHLVGRATSAEPDRIFFADDLAGTLQKADTGLNQLLGKIDGYIEANVSGSVPPAQDIPPVECPQATDQVVFEEADINSIIWATGYERKFPWLNLPILDEHGDIRHERGITPEPGVVVLGMRFQMTKGSNLIDGVGADAEELAEHLATREETRSAA